MQMFADVLHTDQRLARRLSAEAHNVTASKGKQRRSFPNTLETSSTSCCLIMKCHLPPDCNSHTFSPGLLSPSAVSVLISVTTDMSPTGDLLAAFILYWGSVLIWPRGLQVLHQDSTFPGCTAPLGVTCVACRCQESLLSDIHLWRHLVMAARPAVNAVVNNFVNLPGWLQAEIQQLVLRSIRQ